MSNLQRFDQDGLELVINTTTGESFATISGYARMAGKDKSTISRRCQSVASGVIKTAEILTPGGLQGVALLPEKLIAEWLLKDNAELAYRVMTAGIRVFLHGMAGYRIQSTAVTHDLTSLASLLENLSVQFVEQQNQLKLLHERTQRLDQVEQEYRQVSEEKDTLEDTINSFVEAGEKHDGCYKIIESEVNKTKTALYTAYEFLLENNYSLNLSLRLAKRTATFYRCSLKQEPFKNAENIMLFEERYLEQAYQSLKDE